jgi:hypothetical protein
VRITDDVSSVEQLRFAQHRTPHTAHDTRASRRGESAPGGSAASQRRAHSGERQRTRRVLRRECPQAAVRLRASPWPNPGRFRSQTRAQRPGNGPGRAPEVDQRSLERARRARSARLSGWSGDPAR